MCADKNDGAATLLDLGDGWAPAIFSETLDHPQPYRRTFVALANERIGEGRQWDTARRNRYFELYGIFPSFSVVRARLLDDPRHRCHASVDGQALRALNRTLAPWTIASEAARRTAAGAITAAQQHLRCEGLLEKEAEGTFDGATQEALRLYQRRHMLPSAGVLDLETRDTLLADSRELDFRTLLRALRERVVDASGLVEDGSALNAWEPILGRFIDSSEYRRVLRSAPLERARATSSAAPRKRPRGPSAGRRPTRRLGRSRRCRLPRVAVRLAPVPAYHAKPMRLRPRSIEAMSGPPIRSTPMGGRGRLPSRTGRPSRSSSRPTPARSRWSAGRRRSARGNRRRSTTTPRPFATRRRPSDDGTGAISSRRRHGSRHPRRPTGSSCGEHLTDGGRRTKTASDPVTDQRTGWWLCSITGRSRRAAAGSSTRTSTSARMAPPTIARSCAARVTVVTAYSTISRSGSERSSSPRPSTPVTGSIDERYGRVLHWKGRTLRLRAESRGYRYELVSPIPVDVLPGRRVRSKAIPVPVFPLPAPPSRPTGSKAAHDAADLTAALERQAPLQHDRRSCARCAGVVQGLRGRRSQVVCAGVPAWNSICSSLG